MSGYNRTDARDSIHGTLIACSNPGAKHLDSAES